MHSELLALAVNRVPFLRPREKLQLLQLLPGPGALAALGVQELARLLGRRVLSRAWDPREYLRASEWELANLTPRGILCTFYWDQTYPAQLREIYDPPVLLYYRGRLTSAALTAVVGTRKPSGAAREAAYELGLGLARGGVGSVSGLARGIDAEAHRGSLDGEGYTVAVLGCGVEQAYPTSSRALARRILSGGGALLSEYPPGCPAEAFHFPARNRIISGLAHRVVVVQAPQRSGALITADYALEQGRDLVVHAVGLSGSVGAGSRGLWREGAPVVHGSGELLERWGPEVLPPLEPAPAPGLPRREKGSEEVGRMLARQMELELREEITVRGYGIYPRGRKWQETTTTARKR